VAVAPKIVERFPVNRTGFSSFFLVAAAAAAAVVVERGKASGAQLPSAARESTDILTAESRKSVWASGHWVGLEDSAFSNQALLSSWTDGLLFLPGSQT